MTHSVSFQIEGLSYKRCYLMKSSVFFPIRLNRITRNKFLKIKTTTFTVLHLYYKLS